MVSSGHCHPGVLHLQMDSAAKVLMASKASTEPARLKLEEFWSWLEAL